jgi:hypothetical protein
VFCDFTFVYNTFCLRRDEKIEEQKIMLSEQKEPIQEIGSELDKVKQGCERKKEKRKRMLKQGQSFPTMYLPCSPQGQSFPTMYLSCSPQGQSFPTIYLPCSPQGQSFHASVV